MAHAALRQFGLDKVLFIPAFIPPHKKEKRDMTPAPYRYRMVEAAIADQPAFEISDMEFLRPEISYTVETLQDLKKKYPEDELFLILGSDSLIELPKWRDPDEISRLAKILVARRPGSASSNPESFEVQWIEMPECPLSSSEIREKLRRSENLGENILPAGVLEYVRKTKLYQEERTWNSG